MTSTVSQQFGVVAQVEIIPPFEDGIRINPDVTPGVVQGRIDWHVRKAIGGSQPASASARMYNLSQSSRDLLGGQTRRIVDFADEFAFLDGRLVTGQDLGGQTSVMAGVGFGILRLSAKYSGSSTTARLFDGTLSYASSSLANGHTWVTDAQGTDGVIQNSAAIADKFWAGDVAATEVMDYLIRRVMVAELATPVPDEIARYTFRGGFDATNIYATDILDALTELTRTRWWWDDGAVYLTSAGQPLPGPTIRVSTRPGPGSRLLVSKPQRTADNQVVLPLLLAPDVRPGSRLEVDSGELRGEYVAASVEHRGQNRGAGSAAKTWATCDPLGVVGFL